MAPKQATYQNGTPRKGPPSRTPSTFPPLTQATLDGVEPGAEGDAFIADDPLAELLGNKGTGYVGEQGDTLPEELVDFLTVNDMGGKRFQVILKQVSEGSGEGASAAAYVKAWYRAVPSIEHIARNYGPGRYAFHISWQATDPETGKSTSKIERISFEVSEKYEQEHLEYQRDQKLIAAKKRQEKVRQMKDDRQLDKALSDDIGEPVDVKQNAKEYLREVTEIAGQLGLTKPEQAQKGLMEQIAPFLPLMVPLIQGFMENSSKLAALQQQQYQSMMTLMLAQAEKGNQQLLEVIKTTNGQGSGSAAVKEFRDMVMGAIDLKDALKGRGEESVMDRVFGVVEAVLPQIVAIAATSKQQQAVDPRVHLARAFVQTNPDFRAVLSDPDKVIEMVHNLDAHYGSEQTDMILTVANIPRPVECQRVPTPTPTQEEVASEPGDTQEGL